jgi:hypothetical protein
MYVWYCTEVDYSLATIETRMVIDPCEQYERGLEVPFKSAKVRKMNSVLKCFPLRRTVGTLFLRCLLSIQMSLDKLFFIRLFFKLFTPCSLSCSAFPE